MENNICSSYCVLNFLKYFAVKINDTLDHGLPVRYIFLPVQTFIPKGLPAGIP